MEFTGDEKRIRALFSESALDDQSHAPRFEKLWWRAETNARVPAPLVTRWAVVTAAILGAVVLIATSSWYGSSRSEQAASIPPQIIPTTSESRVTQPEQLVSANAKDSRPVRPRRMVRQRQSERAAIHQAAVLSNWQSPTNILLNSPTATVLSSLPQLNQSARDLELFLPKNNDVMKESKQ
jgi:hypothetical protein